MISSGAFNYINVLEKATDASWTRNALISNNIANVALTRDETGKHLPLGVILQKAKNE